jgi:hypothetical protein
MVAMAMAMAAARGGAAMASMDKAGRREEEKTVALCEGGRAEPWKRNLASTRCEGSGLCVKGVSYMSPF